MSRSTCANKRHPQFDEFIPKAVSSQERAVRRDMCMFIQRAYDQRLFTSTQGTFRTAWMTARL